MIRRLKCIFMSLFLLCIYIASSESCEGFPGDEKAFLNEYVSRMSLEEKVGQLFMTTVSGKELSANDALIIKKTHVGGIVLYSYNFKNTEQTVRLTDSIQKTAGNIPMLIATDQEGGRVERLPFATKNPGNMALGAARSPDLANSVGFVIGKELKALGINVNLAPVLDICQNNNSAIGTRSFGSDPEQVADLGLAYMKGLRDAGVTGTIKHFPGLGGTSLDSHVSLPVIPYNIERLRSVELKPFQKAFDNGAGILMTAHAAYPEVEPTKIYLEKENRDIYMPATLSYKLLTGLARNQMGFKGVILTDALHMNSVREFSKSQEEASVMAIKAGADMLMVHTNLEKSYNRVINAVKKGEISNLRINQSVKRVLDLKLKMGIIKIANGRVVPGDNFTLSLNEKIGFAIKCVGSPENRAILNTVAEQSVTLLKNDNVLPFKAVDGSRIVVFSPSEKSLVGIKSSINAATKIIGLKNISISGHIYSNRYKLTPEQKNAVRRASFIIHDASIYGYSNKNSGKDWSIFFLSDLINHANALNKPLTVISVGDPCDIVLTPGVKAYLTVYGTPTDSSISAGIKTVFGLNKPSGKLPVPIWGSDGVSVLYQEGYGLEY
ncbi:MAG: beta-N-acetylhexosaminidase [Bacillota bacterium]